MTSAVKTLLEILDLETLEYNLFRGRSPQVGWQRVFGGQVIGQALVAAIRTVEGRNVHSMHGYFMRPGDPEVPIIYQVERDRDGKSFATRRVIAIQHGQPIFTMGASFHKLENGFDHQIDMPDVPAPEDLPSEQEMKDKHLKKMPGYIRQYWERDRPFELRPVKLRNYLEPGKSNPAQNIWIKATKKLPEDPATHQCVLSYASDITLLDTSLLPHGHTLFDPEIMLASLDHSLWFHRPVKADEWLLYAQDSPSAFGARGFNRGHIFSRDGTLLASVAQEGLIRKKTR
jgi:acyl-CoA thioesterase II